MFGLVGRTPKIICHPVVTGTGREQVTLNDRRWLSRHIMTPELALPEVALAYR